MTEARYLYIVRGLPGAGKSTLAARLSAHVCEADSFFVGVDGRFRYDLARAPVAHQECARQVAALMRAHVSPIAVANVFVRRRALAVYYALAHEHGYEPMEITLSGPVRPNVHGVTEAAIEGMRADWEL